MPDTPGSLPEYVAPGKPGRVLWLIRCALSGDNPRMVANMIEGEIRAAERRRIVEALSSPESARLGGDGYPMYAAAAFVERMRGLSARTVEQMRQEADG